MAGGWLRTGNLTADALFTVTLPTASASRTPVPGVVASLNFDDRAPAHDQTVQQSRILVVDDDPAVRRMIRVVFSERGQSVEDARDAAHAIDLLSQGSYDLIIADPRAAVSAGETFADVSLSRWPELRDRMILVTADVRHETDEWLRGLGCRYFRKPFKINELRNAAEEIGRTNDGQRTGRTGRTGRTRY